MENRRLKSNYRPRVNYEEPAEDGENLKEDVPEVSDVISQSNDSYKVVLTDGDDNSYSEYDQDETDDDDIKRYVANVELAEAVEDVLDKIVQGADEIEQMIWNGIDGIFSVL